MIHCLAVDFMLSMYTYRRLSRHIHLQILQSQLTLWVPNLTQYHMTLQLVETIQVASIFPVLSSILHVRWSQLLNHFFPACIWKNKIYSLCYDSVNESIADCYVRPQSRKAFMSAKYEWKSKQNSHVVLIKKHIWPNFWQLHKTFSKDSSLIIF